MIGMRSNLLEIPIEKSGRSVVGYDQGEVDSLFRHIFDNDRRGFACTIASDFQEQLAVMRSVSRVGPKELAARLTLFVPTGEADELFEVRSRAPAELEQAAITAAQFISRSSILERVAPAVATIIDELVLNLREHVYRTDPSADTSLRCCADPGGIWVFCSDSVGAISYAGLKSSFQTSRARGDSGGGYGMSVMLASASALHICSRRGEGSLIALRVPRSVSGVTGKHFSIWTE